jgi:hypothetical protein
MKPFLYVTIRSMSESFDCLAPSKVIDTKEDS